MASISEDTAHVILCPWPSKYRRDLLFHKLFEGDDNSKMDGMNEIAAWKARTFPRIPLGVEVTTDLIRALLYDQKVQANDKQKGGVGTLQRDCVAHMFSMAVIRFVNLVTEVGQDAGFSKPIVGISEKMGVPEWIVDLRHSASHAALPELSVLRTAVEWALQWVKINYWQFEDSLLYDVESISTVYDRKKIESSLRLIRSHVYNKLGNNSHTTQTKLKNLVNGILLKILPRKSRALWNKTVVDVLVHDGYLVPFAKHLSMIVTKSGPSPEAIFKSLREVWSSLVDELVELELTWPIVAALADSLPSITNLEMELSLRWMAVLMERTKDSSKPKMRPKMNWPRICKLVMASPVESTAIQRVLRLVKQEYRVPNLGSLKKIVTDKSPGTLRYLQESWLKQDRTKKDATTRPSQPKEATTSSSNDQHRDRRFVPVPAEEVEAVWSKYPLGVLPNNHGNTEFLLELPAAVDRVNLVVSKSNVMSHFFGNRKRVTPCYNSMLEEGEPAAPIADVIIADEIFDDHPILL